MEGFPASASSITDATVTAYAIALNGIEIEHVQMACGRFIRGQIERFDHNRAPSAAELTREAERLQDEARRKLGYDTAHPVIQSPPEGYRLTKDKRNIIVPAGQPMPAGYATIGPLKANFGHGEIDMSWMTPEQKRRVLASNGRDVPERQGKALVA